MEALPRQPQNYYHKLLGVLCTLEFWKGIGVRAEQQSGEEQTFFTSLQSFAEVLEKPGRKYPTPTFHSLHLVLPCRGFRWGSHICPIVTHLSSVTPGVLWNLSGWDPLKPAEEQEWGHFSAVKEHLVLQMRLNVNSGTSHIAQPALPSPNNKTKPHGNNPLLEFNKQPVPCSQQKNYLHSFPPPTY